MSEGTTRGGITRKVLTGRSARGLISYEEEREGKEGPLFSAARNCSSDVATQILEWQQTRQMHGTDGAARATRGQYETVDPETGLHASGQMGTHVKYFDGKTWRKRPVRDGETPTHLRIEPEALVTKESEAIHTIYAAGPDLVNPENIEDCARFFLAVKAEREALYPGLQEKLWLERNGESGLAHVHVASNATIYEDFTLDGVDYRAGQKMAKSLTKVDDIRARSDAFLDAHPEFGFSQALARVGTREYERAQRRDGQLSYWEAKRGQESNQDRIRRLSHEALLDDGVHSHDSYAKTLDELGVAVEEVGLRRGKPTKSHDYSYRVQGTDTWVRGRTLGPEFTHDGIDAQLTLKALGQEIEPPQQRQSVGAAKPLPFEGEELTAQQRQAREQMLRDVEALVRDEREKQAREIIQAGPQALGRRIVSDFEQRRSAWSARDLERAIDRRLEPVRELGLSDAETLRAGAMEATTADLVSIVNRDDLGGGVRHWTTRAVIDNEEAIVDSLYARAQRRGTDGDVKADRGDFRLTDEQIVAAKSMTGTHALVVVEGAAGVGKTTVLDAANEQIKRDGRRMVVVSPTKRGALEAGEAIGAEGNSVHSLLYRAGARMDPENGNRWVLPQQWEDQPEAFRMDRDTVLVVDEVGMLDKGTAAALHTYVDDMGVGTVVLTGDTRQLAAVGRGGYLSRAGQISDVHHDLSNVRRFKTADGEIDAEYADASVALREGKDLDAFYDLLLERKQVSTGTEGEAVARVADSVAREIRGGEDSIAVASTNAIAQQVNHATYERLAEDGDIDTSRVVQGRGGDPIAVGAKVATRKNDRDMDVANRETWRVAAVDEDGSVEVQGLTDPDKRRVLTPEYVSEHLQHAWAVTAHGAQGMTTDRAHTIVSDHMDAAGLYVAMTRGRRSNTLHATTEGVEHGRAQFRSAMRRFNADQGLDQARLYAQKAAQRLDEHRERQERDRSAQRKIEAAEAREAEQDRGPRAQKKDADEQTPARRATPFTPRTHRSGPVRPPTEQRKATPAAHEKPVEAPKPAEAQRIGQEAAQSAPSVPEQQKPVRVEPRKELAANLRRARPADLKKPAELVIVNRARSAKGGVLVDIQLAEGTPLAKGQRGLHLRADRVEAQKGTNVAQRLSDDQWGALRSAAGSNATEVDGHEVIGVRARLMPTISGPHTVVPDSATASQRPPIGPDVLERQRAAEDASRQRLDQRASQAKKAQSQQAASNARRREVEKTHTFER